MHMGASSHLADNTSTLISFSNSSIYPSVFVGNGHSIPVTHTGHSFLHTSCKPIHLNHILVTPHIIKNLISVRQFTRDNDVSVEFDAYGFSVKDYQTERILLRCDSTGDLYPVTQQPWSQTPICDHGGEYDNTRFHELFRQNGIQFWFSCPRTSQQNGKSERMLRTINNLIRTLLFQAHMPPSYWVEALNMAAHLLNILLSTAINNEIPFTKLYNQTPTYEDLRVFGCLCYPHVDASHKLETRSTPCIFLGYPANHRSYRCLDLASNKIIISRHVRFDEDVFSFGNVTSSNTLTYDFLLPPIQTTTNVPTTEPFVQHIDEPNNPITPHHSALPTSPLQPDTPPSHNSTPIPTSAPTQSHAQMVDSHTLIPINNSSQTMSTHPMVTRAKAGIFKLLERMNCHVTTTSLLPRSHVHALRDPHWKEAMLDEYNVLISNGTWVLVPRPAKVNVVRSVWLFKHKFKADGSLSRYKARLVANGHSQQQGIDCDKTFSLVVKPAIIHTVLSLAVSRDWPIHQLDVKNAFLHGHLSETVYMHQPPGFRFASYATRVGFQHSKTDSSLFVFLRGYDIDYLLLYVDDIILTASSSAFLQRIITSLHSEFAMTDLGSLNYFLGISAQRSATGLFLSQSKFTEKILKRAHMQNCNPCRTPVDTESKLVSDGDPVCLYMHDPRDSYFTALKRILRYVHGTLDYGLQLYVSSITQLTALRNSGFTLSRSSAEAEYRGVVNVVAETAWIRNLLCELHTSLFTATLVYCDNVSVVYMSANPVQHQRTKHIELDIHFVRDFVASGQVEFFSPIKIPVYVDFLVSEERIKGRAGE
ncbi:ribonuclease H-like domain-containing protein [Tanacetum coccineum]|uniref:Ribonuclease H-like domain-containing protein n=1 Tax=Tanacetum coccineum TaxID=301880 RepID=A0ABQ5IJC6_9ASTR